MAYPFLPVNPCCTDVVINDPCGCSSVISNSGCNSNDPCSTNLTASSTIAYDGLALSCIIAEPCDTLNVILQKIDEIICNLLTQINTLTIQVNNISTQIINIEGDIINIDNSLDACCNTTTSTTTTVAIPCQGFTLNNTSGDPVAIIVVDCATGLQTAIILPPGESNVCVDTGSPVSVPVTVIVTPTGPCTPSTTTTTTTSSIDCTFNGSAQEVTTTTTTTAVPTTTTTSSSTSTSTTTAIPTTTTTTTVQQAIECTTWNWEQSGGDNTAGIEYTNCSGTTVILTYLEVSNNSGSICVAPNTIPIWTDVLYPGATYTLSDTSVPCCLCLTFNNTDKSDQGYSYTDCSNVRVLDVKITSNEIVKVCGSQGSVSDPAVTIAVGGACVLGVCPEPTTTTTTTVGPCLQYIYDTSGIEPQSTVVSIGFTECGSGDFISITQPASDFIQPYILCSTSYPITESGIVTADGPCISTTTTTTTAVPTTTTTSSSTSTSTSSSTTTTTSTTGVPNIAPGSAEFQAGGSECLPENYPLTINFVAVPNPNNFTNMFSPSVLWSDIEYVEIVTVTPTAGFAVKYNGAVLTPGIQLVPTSASAWVNVMAIVRDTFACTALYEIWTVKIKLYAYAQLTNTTTFSVGWTDQYCPDCTTTTTTLPPA